MAARSSAYAPESEAGLDLITMPDDSRSRAVGDSSKAPGSPTKSKVPGLVSKTKKLGTLSAFSHQVKNRSDRIDHDPDLTRRTVMLSGTITSPPNRVTFVEH